MANRRIDDYEGLPHTSEMMMKSKNKNKEYRSAEGDGGITDYPDTTEDIHRDQEHASKKMASKKMKPGYRY